MIFKSSLNIVLVGVSGLQEEHAKTNCVQDRSIKHAAVQGQQEEDSVTEGCFCHNP